MKTETTLHAAIGNENTLKIGYFIYATKRSIEVRTECENTDVHYAIEALILAGFEIKKVTIFDNETGELYAEMKSVYNKR